MFDWVLKTPLGDKIQHVVKYGTRMTQHSERCLILKIVVVLAGVVLTWISLKD